MSTSPGGSIRAISSSGTSNILARREDALVLAFLAGSMITYREECAWTAPSGPHMIFLPPSYVISPTASCSGRW